MDAFKGTLEVPVHPVRVERSDWRHQLRQLDQTIIESAMGGEPILRIVFFPKPSPGPPDIPIAQVHYERLQRSHSPVNLKALEAFPALLRGGVQSRHNPSVQVMCPSILVPRPEPVRVSVRSEERIDVEESGECTDHLIAHPVH